MVMFPDAAQGQVQPTATGGRSSSLPRKSKTKTLDAFEVDDPAEERLDWDFISPLEY